MNILQTYIMSRFLDECAVMNALQDHGVISDECINASDVAPSDCDAAVTWLKVNYRRPKNHL